MYENTLTKDNVIWRSNINETRWTTLDLLIPNKLDKGDNPVRRDNDLKSEINKPVWSERYSTGYSIFYSTHNLLETKLNKSKSFDVCLGLLCLEIEKLEIPVRDNQK